MFETTSKEIMQRGSMDKPTERFAYPSAFDTRAQTQQLRVNTLPSPTSTLRTPRIQNNVPSVPKPVRNIRLSRSPLPGDNVRVTVHFERDPSDVAYQSANVYLQQGNGTHQLVTSTQNTLTSFTTSKTGAASVVTVQSVGSGSAVPVGNSPGKAVNLA